VSYRTPLEARVAKKVAKAIIEHQLIEDGDRVMIGLSGGKDSWALLQVLDVLRKRAPIDFSLVAVNVNSGYEGFRHDVITDTCRERGWECHIEHTTIGAVMDDLLDDNDTPCSLCARLRRGVLYRLATVHGATKIALGHHLDDFIETALLSMFFQGALKAMPAVCTRASVPGSKLPGSSIIFAAGRMRITTAPTAVPVFRYGRTSKNGVIPDPLAVASSTIRCSARRVGPEP